MTSNTSHDFWREPKKKLAKVSGRDDEMIQTIGFVCGLSASLINTFFFPVLSSQSLWIPIFISDVGLDVANDFSQDLWLIVHKRDIRARCIASYLTELHSFVYRGQPLPILSSAKEYFGLQGFMMERKVWVFNHHGSLASESRKTSLGVTKD